MGNAPGTFEMQIGRASACMHAHKKWGSVDSPEFQRNSLRRLMISMKPSTLFPIGINSL